MPLDEKAKQFLGSAPVAELPGQKSVDAEQRLLSFRKKEFLQRAGELAESMTAFFVQQRKSNTYLDDECAGGLALMLINLRDSYGSPQNADEKKAWTAEKREARLAEFDAICEVVQEYYDTDGEM